MRETGETRATEPCYSPSQTETWLRCPILRALKYQDGWTPRWVEQRDVSAVLGLAFAKGAEVLNRSRQQGRLPDLASAEQAARQHAIDIIDGWTRAGRIVPDRFGPQLDAMADRAGRAILSYAKADPIPHDWPILGVERRYPPELGSAQPDLEVEDHGRAPIDYKVKLTLKADYRDREIARYRNSWQLYHYAWLPPRADHYYIVLVVCEPRFSAELLRFDIHPEWMARWEASAPRVWQQMHREDEGLAMPWMAAKHADEYGECEMYRACFECMYDPGLMAQHYIRRGGNPRGESST